MFSIISMAHNHSSFTEMLLTSLANPACCDVPFELVFIDNGSSDQTASLVQSFPLKKNKFFMGLQWASFPENRGVAAAINEGVRLSRFPLILQADNDVVFGPESLSILRVWAQKHPGALISPNWPWIQKKMRKSFPNSAVEITGDLFTRLYRIGLRAPWERGFATGSCWMCSKVLFNQVGGWDEGFRNACASDDFRWKVALAGAESHTIPCPVFHFGEITRKHLDNYTEQERADIVRFQKRWGGHPSDLTVLRHRLREEGFIPERVSFQIGWKYLIKNICQLFL